MRSAGAGARTNIRAGARPSMLDPHASYRAGNRTAWQTAVLQTGALRRLRRLAPAGAADTRVQSNRALSWCAQVRCMPPALARSGNARAAYPSDRTVVVQTGRFPARLICGSARWRPPGRRAPATVAASDPHSGCSAGDHCLMAKHTVTVDKHIRVHEGQGWTSAHGRPAARGARTAGRPGGV